ncbi:DNA repair protein RecN [Butyricicoccus pullicaecorum]|nr:DNA repair protein RecN [Butyricicoccus pullicaecorum]
MLSLLHIENIAVIERADIELGTGLTVLTGETGAGKSIIIDAVGAILGQRTSRDLIRAGASKGLVSAVFQDLPPVLVEKLQDYGLEGEEPDTLHIQRQLSADGKTVSRINMKPVAVSVLREFAPYLINVHGQHDGQKLMDDQYHIDFLDSFADIEEIMAEYEPLYQKLLHLRRRIAELERSEQERLQRVDMLSFHIDEIDEAALTEGEDETLEARKRFFDNAEKLASALNEAHTALDNEEGGACVLLTQAANALLRVAEVSPALRQIADRAEELKYLALDLRESVAEQQGNTDFSPSEQEIVEERLDLIYRLEQKYGGSVSEVLAYAEQARAELETLQSADETRDALRAEYKENLARAKELAQQLSAKRREAAVQLEKRIIQELADLDMGRVRLCVETNVGAKLTSRGMDTVQFLISVNPGEALKPLSKVASGGELSRVMLAMKNVLTSREPVGTLIFDEIDTGVSGRAAQKIARKLAQIGWQKQTICVTHLPQIAAMGDQHLLISKTVRDERTFTTVTPVEGETRTAELARILAGEEITATTLRSAGELIESATAYKREAQW